MAGGSSYAGQRRPAVTIFHPGAWNGQSPGLSCRQRGQGATDGRWGLPAPRVRPVEAPE
jgi:hypothetical protein